MGRYVVEKLAGLGSTVVVPYRGDGQYVRHLKPMGDLGQVVPLPFDITDEESIRRAVCRSNVVINLIGSLHQTRNYSHHDTHVKVLHQILKVVSKSAPVERVIHFSALGADPKSASSFMRSKAEGEEVLKHYFPNATVFRPATIYGHEDKFLNRLCRMVNSLPFLPVIDGGQHRVQPVHCFDVAQGVLHALVAQETAGKTFHLGGAQVYTMRELAEFVHEQLWVQNQIVSLPYPLAKLYGKAFELFPTRFQLLTEDLIVQQKTDNVVPTEPGTLTLAELGVKPAALHLSAGDMFVHYRGDRELPHPKSSLLDIARHPDRSASH